MRLFRSGGESGYKSHVSRDLHEQDIQNLVKCKKKFFTMSCLHLDTSLVYYFLLHLNINILYSVFLWALLAEMTASRAVIQQYYLVSRVHEVVFARS